MDKLINSASLMHDIWYHGPAVRPLSIVLAFIFWGNQIVGSVTHSGANLWLASAASVFAIIRYGFDFYKWLKNRNK